MIIKCKPHASITRPTTHHYQGNWRRQRAHGKIPALGDQYNRYLGNSMR
jgi:hypothetical protein